MSVVTIHQPEHLPWLGFLDKTRQADVVVLLDSVQFKKNYFENRNKIRTANGWAWLTVPVFIKGKFGQNISDVMIKEESRWREVYYRTLHQNYSKAPYWNEYGPFFEKICARPWERIVDLNLEIIRFLWTSFGIFPRIVLGSELGIQGKGSGLLLEICKALEAKEYISGPSGRDYLDESLFHTEGIRVRYHQFLHPEYRQCHSPFVPGLSALDLLMNEGPRSLEILGHRSKSTTTGQ